MQNVELQLEILWPKKCCKNWISQSSSPPPLPQLLKNTISLYHYGEFCPELTQLYFREIYFIVNILWLRLNPVSNQDGIFHMKHFVQAVKIIYLQKIRSQANL